MPNYGKIYLSAEICLNLKKKTLWATVNGRKYEKYRVWTPKNLHILHITVHLTLKKRITNVIINKSNIATVLFYILSNRYVAKYSYYFFYPCTVSVKNLEIILFSAH